ncbi:MAG: TonB-dependent receptor [Caulobacter sp.]|nr:TonB-dependent receptor [Caulobacter sp.]
MPDFARRLWAAALGIATVLLSPGWATAAPRTFEFNIAEKALGAELVEFALRTGLSVGGGNIAACAPRGRPLVGRFTARAGLTRLLAGTGCSFRFIDAGAVEIIVLPRPGPTQARPEPTTPPRPAPPVDLAELVVVATRRPTTVDQLAYPVTALDAATLAGQAVTDAADIAQLSPGMTVTNLGSGRNKILIRGLSDGPLTGRTQSMVGLYLDDVRITYNAPDPDLRLIDMAQVSVLRGPQGALYGAGSLGGVLRLSTNRPELDRVTGWLSGSAGVTHGGDGSSTLEGMLNLPLVEGRAGLRAVAWRDVDGGYIDDVGLRRANVNRLVRLGGRLAARLELNGTWSLTVGLVGQAIDSDDTQYAVAGVGPYQRRNSLREPHDNDFAEARLGLTGRTAWGELRWTAAVVDHHLDSRYDATAAPPVASPPGPVAFDDVNDLNSFVTEASLISGAGAPFDWLVGVFYGRSQQDIDLTLATATASPVVSFTEARRDRLEESALFGEVVLPLPADLDLTLGGRFFSAKGQVRSLIATPLTGDKADFSGRFSHSGFAPKILVSWRGLDGVVLYAGATEGYRSGGFNTTGAPGQAFDAAGGVQPYRRYQGDELWSFEAGARFSSLEGSLQINVTAFETRWSNIQSDQLLASGLPFTANIGDGINRGVEVEGVYRSGPLRLSGNLLVNSPELDRANPAFPARSDLSLAGVPAFSAGLSAHYAWPISGDHQLELDGRLAYVGASSLTFDAQTSPAMGDYVSGRLAASLVGDRWSLTLAVTNPADSRGDTFAYGNPFTLRTTRQMTPQRPRTASLTLRATF